MSVYRLPSPYERPPLRRRASGLVLAVCVNLLLLLVLLTMAGKMPVKPPNGRPLVVDLLPNSQSEPAAAPARSVKSAAKQKTEPKQPTVKPPPVKLPPNPAIPKNHQLPWIEMSGDELASADLNNLKAQAQAEGRGDSRTVGTAPNGEPMYAAEWAREPTDAELGGYLPPGAPEGFGIIACRTIPGDRVDDCTDVDQTPGSHLASAVREAAWQFRVRPPRKGGHELVGSWVEIRIDYEHDSGN